MPERVRVIGVGSPFGADQAGMLVTQRLAKAPHWQTLPMSLSFHLLDRPGPGLIALFEPADLVIIIDALAPGSSVTEIRRVGMDELALADARPSSHAFGVAETLALARALGDLPPELWIYPLPEGNWSRLAEQLAQQLWDDLRALCSMP